MATAVFYSLSPYGAGSGYDLKNGSPTITISGGVATLSVAQTGNIGVGCDIDFDSPAVNVYIAPNRLGFDSGGTTELKIGDKIEGGTSSATGIVRAIEVTSGSWGAGTAAGYIYFSTTSGTWQNNEQIDRTKPSSSSNIATVDGTLQGNLGNGNTQFVVKDADGSDASDVSPAENVNYIYHEYASLSGFEAGFTDANHINNADLTAADVTAWACCYYDHEGTPDLDTTIVDIDWGGTTDSDNYLKIFTPTSGSESINNQRHDGKSNDNKYKLRTTTGWATTLELNEDYIKVEGLQIVTAGPGDFEFAILLSGGAAARQFDISNCIIIDEDAQGYTRGIHCSGAASGTVFNVWNNIIYDFSVSTSDAIRIATPDVTIYCYNNTVHNCGVAYRNDYNEGYSDFILKNSMAQSCTDDLGGDGYNSASTHNIFESAVTEGAWGTGADSGNCDGIGSDTHKLRDTGQNFTTTVQVGCIVWNIDDTTYSYVTVVNSDTELTLNDDIMDDGEDYVIYTNMYGAVTFEDEGNDDFHLGSGDTVAKDKGTDLSSDGNLPIWDDLEADARGATWDVGADEYIEAEITLTILKAVQSNLSTVLIPQLNLLLNPLNTVLNEFANVLTLPLAVETLTILNAVCDQLAKRPELQRGRIVDIKNTVLDELADIVSLFRGRTITSQDAVLDEFAKIVSLLRERLIDPKNAVHDQLANIVTILALKILAIQSAIHDQLSSIVDLTRESTLTIQNALHEQFANILTLILPGVIDLIVQSALHSDLAKKANFSIAMLLRPQAAMYEQKVLNVILQLLQKLTAQSAYHDFLTEKITFPGIILTVQNVVHDALSGKLNMARIRLLDIDNAVHDLINNIPDLTTAYQLIVLDAICSLIVGRPILTEEALIALYTYIAENQVHIYVAKNQTYHYTARDYE